MAKKKHSQSQDPKHPSQPMAAVDDASSVQIQNLKNLNSVLLKETAHHRHHIQSLQSALHRSALVNDINLSLHLEKTVLLTFLDSHLHESSLRLSETLADKDRNQNQVSALESQLRDLKSQFLAESQRFQDTVNREKKLLDEAESLRLQVLEQVSEKERTIAELRKDRDLASKSSREEIEMLKEQVHAVTREKNEMQKVNASQSLKVAALERELEQLEESLKSSRKEEEFMRAKILHMERNLGLALQKEEETTMEIRALLREKEEMEKKVEALTDKNDNVEKCLNMVQKELEGKKCELDEAIRARSVAENAKFICQNEIHELQGEVDRLKSFVEKMKESCGDFEEENKQLISQVNHFKNAVAEAVHEKDNMKMKFDEERKEAEKLLLESKCLMKSQEDKFVDKCMKLEKQIDVLTKEKIALESALVEANGKSDDLRAKIEFWSTNSVKALALLKSTAALVCQHKDGEEEEEVRAKENIAEEIQPYAEELDAIKKAFKRKSEVVDEMKLQLVSMKKSVAEAHKSKSLWTAISSATTIFAAVLAAYFARGR